MHALPPKKRIREDVCMAGPTVRKDETPEPSSSLSPASLALEEEVRLRLTEDEALARALQEEEDVSTIIIINPLSFPLVS